MEDFEKWVNLQGFTQVALHWSERGEKETPGMEGILILSKIPFKVRYGMCNPEFALLEFISTY